MTDMTPALREFADLLDPAPSLRDEVADAMYEKWSGHSQYEYGTPDEMGHASHGCVLIHEDPRTVADVALAVVRKRIADLSWSDRNWEGYTPEEAYEAGRDDALRLLRGSDESR